MPIYEYQCQACDHRMEHLQKLSDPDPLDCPVCAAPQLKRRVSAPAFRLSGSGWYETDFKSDKEKKRNLAGDNGEAKPAASQDAPAASAGANSKPAAVESKPAASSTAAASAAG